MTDSVLDHAWAVVMAGGAGTRFWPLSRKTNPKQLLALAGERSLLAETVARIGALIPAERVIIVTGAHLVDATRAQLPDVPPENFLAEPVPRNTAPCVGWAAMTVQQRDPRALLAVLAADHFVADLAEYQRVVRAALGVARSGALVTLGMKPTRAETGYGYLRVGKKHEDGSHRVDAFIEKPELAKARRFAKSAKYLWNSGQFFFEAEAVLEQIAIHLPALSSGLNELRDVEANREGEALAAIFRQLPSISIDHGVMENAKHVRVVPADFGWSDVGSWTTAWELGEKDADGNVVAHADAVLEDARGNYVRARDGKIVALVGVEDLVVVDTEDALLVMPRSRAQDVKLAVTTLTQRTPSRGT
jgi:mannose-1-phosphate guanylyltransferase